MQRSTRIMMIGLVVLALVAGTIGGVLLGRTTLAPALAHSDAASARIAPDGALLNEALQTIQQHYVGNDELDSQQLTYGAISGMVDALGDTGHSRFLSPTMVKEEQAFEQGSFEGIGAEVQAKDGATVIVAPIADSPAMKAGVQAGDIIVKVDDEDVTEQTVTQVVQKIRGPAGSQVKLTLLRGNEHLVELTITRAHIDIHPVTWQPIEGTQLADVHLAAFSDGADKELRAALSDIQQQGYKGIVLDLRNDPGGLLDEAQHVASEFLSSGIVLQEVDAQDRHIEVPVLAGGVATDLPVVVLINSGTASSAEIVTGALQDAGRATVVGETTFGTGTVLRQFPLSDGSAILLAVQEWRTPQGRTIWHTGLTPDQEVKLPLDVIPVFPATQPVTTTADPQLAKAVAVLQAQTK